MSMIGDNIRPLEPPPSPEAIKANLDGRYVDMAARALELEALASSVPSRIDDDSSCGRVQEIAKAIRVFCSAMDSTRKIEGEGYSDAKKAVDAWFNTKADVLYETKKDGHFQRLMRKIDAYLEEKAAIERRRREEEARRQREEEERLLREAEAAEARRQEAEREKARQEQIARIATSAAERIKAEQTAKQIKADIREATRDEKEALQGAVRADKRAERLEVAASGRPADLSRTRSELGTVASLAERWVFRVVDRQKIPLEALRGYIAADAIDAAISKFKTDHANELDRPGLLPGVEFELVASARVI